MSVVYAAAALAIVGVAFLVLIRLFLGPSVFDRALALNSFGTKTVLLIALFGYMEGRPDFLDVAILYALMNFIGTVAVLKFQQHHSFAVSVSDDQAGEGE